MEFILILAFLAGPALGAYDLVPGDLNPKIREGMGAGEWNSKPAETNFKGWKHYLQKALVRPDSGQKLGPHAVEALLHYFSNQGTELKLEITKLAEESNAAGQDLENWQRSLARYAETLPLGEHSFTSPSPESVVIEPEESADWYRTLGKYQSWIRGKVLISNDKREAHYTYEIWDRYDWEPGPTIFLSPEDFPFLTIQLTQDFMGEFHRQGLAKEFVITGSAGIVTVLN